MANKRTLTNNDYRQSRFRKFKNKKRRLANKTRPNAMCNHVGVSKLHAIVINC